MKRMVAFLGLFGLLVGLAATAVATNTGTYADDFQSSTYHGSTGSLEWASPWYEWNDDGNPKVGAVHVGGYVRCPSDVCVHIENEDLTSLGKAIGVKRYADTSVFERANLYYSVSAESLLGISGSLRVQVSTDSGGSWSTLKTYALPALEGEVQKAQIDIGDYLCDAFAVRFLVSGLLGGYAFVDDVVIEGELLDGGGTTTTTVPDTTTTEKAPTTTTRPSTTTTEPTTTTTTETTSTTTRRTTTTPANHDTQATNTTSTSSTTTTVPQLETTTTDGDTTTTDREVVVVPPDEPPSAGGGGPDFGLRQSRQGIQADMGNMTFAHVDGDAPVFKPVDAAVNFSLVVETIETSWVWMVLFGLVLAWAILSDLDRRWLKGMFSG